MPPPGNASEFLTVVEKSGLLEETDIDRYRFRSSADPSPPDRVANWMIMDGRLTQFQVGLLLAGKSRPFFIGPYKVLSRIGNGSMGVIYLCEHKSIGNKVAVKILQNRRVQDEVALERFLRETRAASALNHPNVVHALDFGSEESLYYLVMEHIDGQSLKALILSEGTLPPLKAADYLRQAALGLQHAHEAGLIHRDIKPSNLMIDREGVVKLLDLGLARFAEGEVDLTRGVALGTMAYVAPEQAKDSHTVDARADIYSLGATFYLAVSGRPPIPGIGIGADVPSWLSDNESFLQMMTVLRRMTARAPADRYQSAADVAAEMDLLISLLPSRTDEQCPAESHTQESPESNPAEPVEQTSTESVTVESPDATAMEEDRALEAFSELKPEPQWRSKPPSKPLSKPRSPSPSRVLVSERSCRWKLAQDWLVERWQPLILVLAVVVGLVVVAIVTREPSLQTKENLPNEDDEIGRRIQANRAYLR